MYERVYPGLGIDYVVYVLVFPYICYMRSGKGNKWVQLVDEMGKAQTGKEISTEDIERINKENALALEHKAKLDSAHDNYIQGRKITDTVDELVEHNVDIWRPPVGTKEKIIDWVAGPFKDCFYNNTCVEAVKKAYKWSGYDSGIPDDVYDNKTFFKNYKDYGFELIDAKDAGDLKKGDVLQYYHEATQVDWSDQDLGPLERRMMGVNEDNQGIINYPESQFHMGIYIGDGKYWGDGSGDEPSNISDISYREDGSEKEKFRVFRRKNVLKTKKHGGNHHEWADYDLNTYQKRGEFDGVTVGENGKLVMSQDSPQKDYLLNELNTEVYSTRWNNEIEKNKQFLQNKIDDGKQVYATTYGNMLSPDFRAGDMTNLRRDGLLNTQEYLGMPSEYGIEEIWRDGFLGQKIGGPAYMSGVGGVSYVGDRAAINPTTGQPWEGWDYDPKKHYNRLYYGQNIHPNNKWNKLKRFLRGNPTHSQQSLDEVRSHELGHSMTNNDQLITPYAKDLLRRSKTLTEDRSDVSFKEWKELKGHGKRKFGEWGSDFLKQIDLKSGDSRREAYTTWKNAKTDDYLTNPAEVYTRYKKGQKHLKDAGIFDHTTGQPFTEEDYNRVKEWMLTDDFKNADSDVREFFGTDDWTTEYNKEIKKEDLMEIMNNVADNSEMGSDDLQQGMYAKHGGQLPSYQNRGELFSYLNPFNYVRDEGTSPLEAFFTGKFERYPEITSTNDKDEAFAIARDKLGPGKMFLHNGVRYKTDYAGETEDIDTNFFLANMNKANDDGIFDEWPGLHDRLIEVWTELGQPDISMGDDKYDNMFTSQSWDELGLDRSDHVNPFTDRMWIQSYKTMHPQIWMDAVINELTHVKQQRKMGRGKYMGRYFSELMQSGFDQGKLYDTEGTLENQAHTHEHNENDIISNYIYHGVREGEKPKKTDNAQLPPGHKWIDLENPISEEEFNNRNQKRYGAEVGAGDTDIVTDKYNLETEGVDDSFMESSGNEEVIDPPATKYGAEIKEDGGSVWDRKRYTTSAKKYRRGGESLPKYQTKGQVSTLEKNRKEFTQTGEYYAGVLSGHHIGDFWDFQKHAFKGSYTIDDPEIQAWRSVKGFSLDQLLSWYYGTQMTIPYSEVTQSMDKGVNNWKDKNYGYPVMKYEYGASGALDSPAINEYWYPIDKSMAHAMSRDLRRATNRMVYFYEGEPFTNEEGDEKDIRLGLKPGKLFQEFQNKLSNAKSKTEVQRIHEEYSTKLFNTETVDGRNNILFLTQMQNPLKISNGAMMEIAHIRNKYFGANVNSDSRHAGGYILDGEEYTYSKEWLLENHNYSKEFLAEIDKLSSDQQDQFWRDEGRKGWMLSSDGQSMQEELRAVFKKYNYSPNVSDSWGDYKKFVNSVTYNTMDTYLDNYLFDLLDPNIANFSNKQELEAFYNSPAFKSGNFNPNSLSYIDDDGSIVQGEDIVIPYDQMYDTYTPWGEDIWPEESSFKPINLEGQFDLSLLQSPLNDEIVNVSKLPESKKKVAKTSIRNSGEALTSNKFPMVKGPHGVNAAAHYMNEIFGTDFDWATWGSFGYDLREVPEYNPWKKEFEWYSYDQYGNVTETHKIPNPDYYSEAAKNWRKVLGPDGTGHKGTISGYGEGIHGSTINNFLAFDAGALSVDNINDGFALSLNPYFNSEVNTKEVNQLIQPHRFVGKSEEQIHNMVTDLAAKNTSKAMEWDGAMWVGGALSLPSLYQTTVGNVAGWGTGLNTTFNYWRSAAAGGTRTVFNPLNGTWGYVGSLGNTINYGFGAATGVYDKSLIGGVTGASIDAGGLFSLNNAAIGGFVYNDTKQGFTKLGQGDPWGALDIGFATLGTTLLYNRAKHAYNINDAFTAGKFTDFNKTNIFKGKYGNYDLGPTGLKLNTGFNPATNTYEIGKMGQISDKIRKMDNWSLGNQLNKTFNNPTLKYPWSSTKYPMFKNKVTQPMISDVFEGGLINYTNKMNKMKGHNFDDIVPGLDLNLSNYKLGDFNKQENLFNLLPK